MRSFQEEAGLSPSTARCKDSRKDAKTEALDWTLVPDSWRRQKIERSMASAIRGYDKGNNVILE